VTEHRVGVEQAIVGREVGRALRRGVLFEIGWRGANDVAPDCRARTVRWRVFRSRGTASPACAELAPRMVPGVPSDYPIYADSAYAGRRIIPVTSGPIYRATHCRIELSKFQATVKNSRLKRRAMTPS
jgi:hypothetical protein